MDYDLDHFINYAAAVQCELCSRDYHPSDAVWKKIEDLKPDWNPMGLEEVYPEKMDEMYLNICFWNLYEKFLCGGITKQEFEKIESVYKKH